jgi:arsenate reductase
MAKQRVLILCTGNSARSQMAEGLLRHDAGDRFDVESAGTKPGYVRPEAIAAMREIGFDISSHRSKHVDEFQNQPFDYVLTVCDNARETCPIYPGQTNRIHHSFEDPAAIQGSEDERLAAFRKVRDQIREYLRTLPQHSTSWPAPVETVCSTGAQFIVSNRRSPAAVGSRRSMTFSPPAHNKRPLFQGRSKPLRSPVLRQRICGGFRIAFSGAARARPPATMRKRPT